MLDLNMRSKSFLSVKFGDVSVNVLAPKRKLLAEINSSKDETDIDAVYELTSKILSNNRENESYCIEDLNELDIIEVQEIILAYMEFINITQKN